MLDKITFRGKINILIGTGVIMMLILAGAGYMGVHKLDLAVKEQTEAASLLRKGDMADMMHDGIYGDGMGALYAASKEINDPKAHDERMNAFLEHAKTFREQMSGLESSPLNGDEKNHLAQVKRDVDNYLQAADSLINLSSQDRIAADQQLTSFNAQFKTLEVSLEKLGDILTSKITDIQTRAESTNQIAYQILFATAILGIMSLVGFSLVIARNVFKELGGDPANIHKIAERISVGDITVSTPVVAGDTVSVMFAMRNMKQALTNLIDDTHVLTNTVMSGDLTKRVDADRHQGAFGQLLEGVNKTLDAVVEPLTLTATYIEMISQGEMPPKFTDFSGDFNTIGAIKHNLNSTIDTLKNLIDEMNSMSSEHEKGDIDIVIDANKFQGAYKVMAQGVNEMVGSHISLKKKAMACVKAFGEGNFEEPLEQFPGKKAFINETIEEVRSHLKNLIEDAYLLAAQAQEGNLSVRANA